MMRNYFAVVAAVIGLAACFVVAAADSSAADKPAADPAAADRPEATSRPAAAGSENMADNARKVIYKKTPQGELALFVHYPPGWKASDQRPAMVFFFGGGWAGGTVEQFRPQAEYFASRGMVTARAEYRVKSIHQVTPDRCVADAKSAVRYLRAHAAAMGIDPQRIVASGGSAGGHIAACAALTEGLEDEPAGVSSRPNALVLFNPVANLTEGPAAGAMAHDPKLARAMSPCLNVKKDSAPAIVFFGEKDRFWKSGGREYEAAAKQAGAKAVFKVYPEQDHGFFNHTPWRERTLVAADEFLAELGFLQGKPTITPPAGK